MTPGTANLDIYRGDTKRWQFRLWADVAKTIPTDLTSVVANATIRDEVVGGSFELPLTCTITLPNIVNMTLTSDQSRSLPSVGVWDLQLNYPSGDIFTPLKGAVVVTQDVTRPVVVINPL